MSLEGQSLFVAIVQDVTEQTKLNEDLLLRDWAMAEVVSGMVITDAKVGENLSIYANAVPKKMTEYTYEEMIADTQVFCMAPIEIRLHWIIFTLPWPNSSP